MGFTCKGEKANGEPCTAPLKEPGYCHHHKDQAPDLDPDVLCVKCESQPAERYGWCKSCEPLTPREKAFVDEYVLCLNGAAAARKAGYSPDSARQRAYEILERPRVNIAKDHLLKPRAMSADEVLARVSAIARGDTSGFPDIDKVNAISVMNAIDALLKLHGLYEEKINHKIGLDDDAERLIRSLMGLEAPGQ